MQWFAVRENVLATACLTFLFRQCGQRGDEVVGEEEEELKWSECRSLMGLRGGSGGGCEVCCMLPRGSCVAVLESKTGSSGITLFRRASRVLGGEEDSEDIDGGRCILDGRELRSSEPTSGMLLTELREVIPTLLLEVMELVLTLLVVLPFLHVLGGSVGGKWLPASCFNDETSKEESTTWGGDPELRGRVLRRPGLFTLSTG